MRRAAKVVEGPQHWIILLQNYFGNLKLADVQGTINRESSRELRKFETIKLKALMKVSRFETTATQFVQGAQLPRLPRNRGGMRGGAEGVVSNLINNEALVESVVS